MSTKPTDTARWGETSGGSVTGNLTIASSGHQDTGWTLSEAPTSGLFNWLAHRAYKWFQWLNDGDCTFHNLAATGTLGVTGASTLTGNTTVGGTLGVTGASTVGGTLGVTGASTFASLSVSGVSALSGSTTVGGTLGVTGLITATGGLTAAANQHMTVSGTGEFKHGARTMILSGSDFQYNNPITFVVGGTINVQASFSGYAGVRLPAGSRILAIRFNIKDSVTGPTTVQGTLESVNSSGVGSVIASSTTSAGTGAAQTLTNSSLSSTVVSGSVFTLSIQSRSGTDFCRVSFAEIDYDRP